MSETDKIKLKYIHSMLYWMCGEIEMLPATHAMSDEITRSIAEAHNAVGAALRTVSAELIEVK